MNPLAFIVGNWQRVLVYAALALVLFAAVWMWGYTRGKATLFEYQAKQATAAVAVARARNVVTERVVKEYIRVAGVTQTITQTIEKEVVKYAYLNPGSCLDARWRELHDAAAEDRLPAPPIVAHGAAGAPTAATAIAAVTDNYAACHRNAERLAALQKWVSEQLEVEE